MNHKVHIVGAGISGLIAAHVLEKNGIKPIILESTERVGGRLKTDSIDKYQLDQGFQVLLSSYEAAKKYLNYTELELQKLKSGACVFSGGKKITIGDPLRDFSVLIPTLFSGIGTFKDKLKILSLNKKLKSKSIEDIFNSKEKTTAKYLREFGFSEDIISRFFKPFFTGIFLEDELETSSRMFEFVFKMFGDGHAVLPKGGIEEISKQLKNKLNNTTFKFNCKVSKVNNEEIELIDGAKIKTNYTIIATESSNLIDNLKNQKVEWKSCQNLYFTTKKRNIEKPFIGLIADKSCLINNIFFHTSIDVKTKGSEELLSVTVVKKHKLSKNELVEKVKEELNEKCNIKELSFLKLYEIRKALPNLMNLKNDLSPSETQLKDRIFLAGDVMLNGSLNAAINSGEKAAIGLLEKIDKQGF